MSGAENDSIEMVEMDVATGERPRGGRGPRGDGPPSETIARRSRAQAAVPTGPQRRWRTAPGLSTPSRARPVPPRPQRRRPGRGPTTP